MDTKVRPNLLHHWRVQQVFALLVGCAIGLIAYHIFDTGWWVALALYVTCGIGVDYMLDRLFPDPLRAQEPSQNFGWEETLLFIGSLIVFFLFVVVVMAFFEI